MFGVNEDARDTRMIRKRAQITVRDVVDHIDAVGARVRDIDAIHLLFPNTRRRGRSPGAGPLGPGAAPGVFAKYINIQDMTALLAGPTGFAPMLGGVSAYDQTCPLPP